MTSGQLPIEPISSEFSKNPVEPFLFDWNVSSEYVQATFQPPKQPSNTGLQALAYISSPTFRANGVNSVSDWVVQMSTRHTNANGIRFLSLFLRFNGFQGSRFTGTNVRVLYSFQIMTANDKPFYSMQSRTRTFDSAVPDQNCFGWIEFLPLQRLGSFAVPVFSIRLNLWILDQHMSTAIHNIMDEEDTEEPMDTCDTGSEEPTDFIPADDSDLDSSGSSQSSCNGDDASKPGLDCYKSLFKLLWVTKSGWDVEVKARDASFQAHSTILTARSNLLAKELPLLPVNEHSKRVYNLEALDSDLVNALLEFSYTGETTGFQDFKKTLELYRAAVKLEMRKLTSRSLQELVRADRLTHTNVAAVMNVLNAFPPDLMESKASLQVLAEYVWNNLSQLKQRADLKELLNLDESEEYKPEKYAFIETLLFENYGQ